MKPLLTDRASTFERRILDVETTGLGTAVEARSSDARPPRALITVVRYPDGQKIRWWGERSIQHAIEQCVEETADGTDVEVLGHFAGSFDFRLELRWFLLRWPCRWRFTKVSSLPLSIEGRPLSTRQADDESNEDDDGRAGRFRLVDTYRILPGKLDDIGKAVGLHKGSWDHGFHSHRDYAGGPTKGKRVGYRFHAPICYEALAKYCELDCDVLDAGVDKIDKFAEDRGVHRRLTIASTSTASIRKGLTKETVATAPPEVREISKLACFGGRVEVFRNECGPARVYDIQSSYPKAMTEGLPWRFERSRPRWDGEEDAIVEAVIEVPDDCEVPVMPLRAPRPEEAGRVYFPTGIFRVVAYGGELAYAVANGFAKVIDVAIAHLFSASQIMGDFAREVWEERRVASGFYKYALKIWLNSAYGKLNEQEERDEIVVRPQSFVCERHRTQAREPGERCGCMEELSRELGLYGYKFKREPSFHAPWAAAGVLGRARVNLHKNFMSALQRGGILYYSDTDSTVTTAEMPTSKGELGALTLERTISSGKFVAPKLYGMTCESCDAKDEDGAPAKHPHEVVRAKGFSRMKMADLDALTHCPRCQASGFRPGTAFGCPRCEGGSLGRPGTGRAPYSYERSEGLGEALRRRQNVDYRRLVVTRALRQTRPKRADGGARPWTVEELAERWVA